MTFQIRKQNWKSPFDNEQYFNFFFFFLRCLVIILSRYGVVRNTHGPEIKNKQILWDRQKERDIFNTEMILGCEAYRIT